MLDGVVVVNEVVDEARRKKNPCCLLKLDFEMTHDSLSWDFHIYMLGGMSFITRWVRWVQCCVVWSLDVFLSL